MKNFITLDAHCDVILKLLDENQELYTNTCHFDLQRAREYRGFIQFFAAFIAPDDTNAYRRAINMLKKFELEVAKNTGHIAVIREYGQIADALAQNKVAAVLTIENGAALQGEMSKLEEFYQLGVRSISLTWNGSNEIGCGVGCDGLTGGLTPFGFDVVRRMNELGMLVDVSHINEASFWDVMDTSSAPIIASHSNAKKMCHHKRNLTDHQFMALVKTGGVAGINLCPPFLNESGTADINDVLRHIEHFMSLGGEDNIGMGADLDGISTTPVGINGVEDLGKIFDALLSKNYTEEQVKKIAGLNFLRVLENII